MGDRIIVENAQVYTMNENEPWAQAFVIEDGRFAFAGSNEEAKSFLASMPDDEPCRRIDAGGRFIMPGIVDSHTHIGLSVMLGGDDDDKNDKMPSFDCKSKAEVLKTLKGLVRRHPFQLFYVMFFGNIDELADDRPTKEDIDKIVKIRPVFLLDMECHSAFLNTGALRLMGIYEGIEDIAKGYSYYERDDSGNLTGFMTEMTLMPLLKVNGNLSKKDMKHGAKRITDFLLSKGVTTVFDAGNMFNEEWTYETFREMEDAGKFPIRMEASYIINHPEKADIAINEFKKLKEKYESENIRFNTIKMMFDGTRRIHTACMVEPYADTGEYGGTIIPKEKLKTLLAEMNEEGIDFHVHAVGGGAVRMVMDVVEELKARPEGFDITVTCAHNEAVVDEDIARFRELGIVANFTPSWNGGSCDSDLPNMERLLGKERAQKILRCRTIYDSGALVTFSSDEVELLNLERWSPFWGMEVGMTRQDPEMGTVKEDGTLDGSTAPVFPSADEKLTLEQLIKGYTINGARQLKLDDRIGSIEAGKEADFLILHENPFEMDVYMIHDITPDEVYIRGRKMKTCAQNAK